VRLETHHETGYLKFNLVETSNGIPNEKQTDIRGFIKHALQILRWTECIRFSYVPWNYGHTIFIATYVF
jgi:hypothetical protein